MYIAALAPPSGYDGYYISPRAADAALCPTFKHNAKVYFHSITTEE